MTNFIALNEEDFRKLIYDLYALYAPDKLNTIDSIVEKYKHSAMDQKNAIQTAHIKYNHSRNSNYYNPNFGKDSDILKVMEDYARGERTFAPHNIPKNEENEESNIKDELEDIKQKQEKQEDEKNETINNLQKQIDDLNSFVENQNESLKEIQKITNDLYDVNEKLKKETEYLKQQFDNNNINQQPTNENDNLSPFEQIDVEIMGEAMDKEEYLPGKEVLATLSIGHRIIAFGEEKEIFGLEVMNISDDYASNPERPKRSIEFKIV